ncbi:vWA domain-containing protein [Rhodococcus cercidiphylli]|uniref:VWA domain-containing protein n=1 Tax=Rhodococcus cercidiphylli TaxID=489916 RepID=A0ABU4B3A8_9NOCA|nr:VWA domain-containing protein [Rhodococcus cercidiphylli]MDV6232972.1 VWA domain-containing protein [Rhodococcus cercidiphylli]
MTTLARGGNTPIEAQTFEVTVDDANGVDLLAFQVDTGRKVRNDDDFVFFNQPSSPEGAVRLSSTQSISIDLRLVPGDVDAIVVAIASGSALSTRAGLIVRCSDIVSPATGLTTETAAVLIEIYRRGGGWKVRNVSAGWDAGFADLVREHGVDVDDTENPKVRSVAGEEKLSMVKREKLDLRKHHVHKVLLKKDAVGLRARIILVIDKTGSMSKQYSTRVVHRVVERMVPVATQLDDDGELEPYLYGSWYAQLPVITVADTDAWADTYLHLYGHHGGIDYSSIGGTNDELPIMKQILSTVVSRQPTLVLFFTDGGFTKRGPIASFMRTASSAPIFWQFIGVGKANYGLLEKLDTMEGRLVDNAGFFALDDIDKVSDAELYERILSEFPDWIREARAAKIID